MCFWCHFRKVIRFHGFKRGIEVDPKNVKSIVSMPHPKSKEIKESSRKNQFTKKFNFSVW